MTEILWAVVDKPVTAQKIIDELTSSCRCDRADISVLGGDAELMGGAMQDAARKGGEMAAKAADMAAGSIDRLTGLGAAVTKNVPGFGVLNVLGSFAASFAKAGLSSSADLARALVESGAAKENAGRYAEAVQGGAILLAVTASTQNMASCAREVLARHGALAPEAQHH